MVRKHKDLRASEGGSSQAKEVSQNVVLIWTLRPEWFCHFLEKNEKATTICDRLKMLGLTKQISFLVLQENLFLTVLRLINAKTNCLPT
jgi:hypothetical protein